MRKFLIGVVFGACLSTATIVSASTTIEAVLFPTNFEFNGITKQLDDEYVVMNYNGHAYVPIRFIIENMDANIRYEEASQKIIVKYGHLDIVDPEEKSVRIGNLILTKDGANTKVTGQLQMDFNGHLGANLSFYDDNGEKLGFVVFNQRYPKGIQSFELTGKGDFTNYSTVKLNVGYLNGLKGRSNPNMEMENHVMGDSEA